MATITNIKSELSGMLHGTNINRIQAIDLLLQRAARQVLADCDPLETQRKATLANALYDSVYDYAAPSDLKMTKIIDIRKQVRRSAGDNFSQTLSEEFDLLKANNGINVEYRNGTKVLRLSKSLTAPTTVNEFNGATGNGTWAAGDDAGTLTEDKLQYVSGSSSLNFDLDGLTTTGYVENSTMTQVDLSDHEDVSSLFMWVYLPDSSAITNVILRWGNDSSNYWSVTATTPHFGSFADGWNLMRFDWNGATETGTGDASAIDYVRVTITYDGTADTDFRLDSLASNIGDIFEVVYYSDSLFQDGTTSALKDTVDDDSDSVILEGASLNLYLTKAAEMAAQQVQEQGSSVDIQYFANEYARLLRQYKQLNPSQGIKLQSTYYRMRNPRRSVRSLPS